MNLTLLASKISSFKSDLQSSCIHPIHGVSSRENADRFLNHRTCYV